MAKSTKQWGWKRQERKMKCTSMPRVLILSLDLSDSLSRVSRLKFKWDHYIVTPVEPAYTRYTLSLIQNHLLFQYRSYNHVYYMRFQNRIWVTSIFILKHLNSFMIPLTVIMKMKQEGSSNCAILELEKGWLNKKW